MDDFFRFPHTPHIAWLGNGHPRGDKILSPEEVDALLAEDVVVEEKVDGANLGISIGPDGQLRAQNRGQYLQAPYTGQFSRLRTWLAQHQYTWGNDLGPELILFGEWCAARHSLAYDRLPDWFLLFDIYDRNEKHFWSTTRRNDLALKFGLTTVPTLVHGRMTPADLQALLESQDSRFRSGAPEGLVVRRENVDWCEQRAKLVRAEFTQAIEGHWRGRSIVWNRVRMA